MRWLRLFTLLVCLLVSSSLTLANDAIVLISPSAAGPDVRLETYSHPLWITWPAPADGSGVNQLVSIVTGNDGIPIQDRDFVFRGGKDGRYTNVAPVNKYGLPNPFWAHSISPLSLGTSGIDKGILAMAACYESNFPVETRIKSEPTSRIYCARAQTWDEVVRISKEISGKTIVVEFPPLAGHRWSRVWEYSHGKLGTHLPTGLIKSDRLLDYLKPLGENSLRYVLDPANSSRSGSPDRWLAVGELTRMVQVGLYVLAWFAILISLGFLSQEVSRVSSRVALYGFLGTYFALRLLPLFIIWSGIGLWWFWLLVLTSVLTALFMAIDLNAKDKTVNPLVVVGLPLMALANLIPIGLSPFGPIYSQVLDGWQMHLAISLIFGAYCFQTQQQGSGPLWFGALLFFPALWILYWRFDSLLMMDGYEVFYIATVFLFQFLNKIVRGLGWLLLMSTANPLFMHNDAGWRGYETADRFQRGTVDFFELVRQGMHPEFIILILGVLFAVVFSSRFESDRLKKVWRESPAIKPLFGICVMVVVWTAGNPVVLGMLPWTLVFAYLLWSHEALRSL